MNYVITAPPTVWPVTLDEAKNHLKVETSITDDDALITRLIKSATRSAEQYTECSFIQQTIKAYADLFPTISNTNPFNQAQTSAIELKFGPFISLSSVQYKQLSDGSVVTLGADQYEYDLVSTIARIKPLTSWPSTAALLNSVIVTFVAGMGSDATEIPEDIKSAILLVVGYMYENREDSVKKLPSASEYLLQPYKRYSAI